MKMEQPLVIDAASSSTDSDDEVVMYTPRLNDKKRRRRSAIMDDDDEEGIEQKSQQVQDEDEDEVIRIGSIKKTPGSSSKKAQRLTILESDEENENNTEEPDKESIQIAEEDDYDEVTPLRDSSRISSSTGSKRRSSQRIARIEESKNTMSVRKLQFATLDNCLSKIQRGNEEEESDTSGEEEDDEFEQVAEERRNRRPQQRMSENRERVYADGGEDLDDFIVDDNEVEYMDEKDQTVIDMQSATEQEEDDEGDDDHYTSSRRRKRNRTQSCRDPFEEEDEDPHAMMIQFQSRERSEWFSIYLDYLEECILDESFDDKMRLQPNKKTHLLYTAAINHIERSLCSSRDSLRGNTFWTEELVQHLKCVPSLKAWRQDPCINCEACNRQNHPASYRVHLSGISFDATELYRPGWMRKLRRALTKKETLDATFFLGSVCYAKTMAWWQFLHAKWFWTAIVDAKIQEFHGELPEKEREELHKFEYGRFKRLTNMVNAFSVEKKDHVVPTNVWKHITSTTMESDFLPQVQVTLTEKKKKKKKSQQKKRTMMYDEDFVVADSDDEEEEETLDFEDEKKDKNNDDELLLQLEKKEKEKEKCLICGENPQNGAIIHGNYMHLYCCYRCGKRQLAQKGSCLACNRPIDSIMRILPLTQEAKESIIINLDKTDLTEAITKY